MAKRKEVIPYKEEDKAESERYSFCQETITLFTQMQIGYMALAQRLYDIRENRLYQPFWESFNAYCMEMSDMSSSVISRLTNIHKKIVIDGGIPSEEVGAAGWSKVAVALPLIHDEQTARHWVDMAKQLNKTDLSREVKEEKTGKPMSGCEHKNYYTIRVCRDCGFKWRVYNDSDATEQ